jgi:hypothetical protein
MNERARSRAAMLAAFVAAFLCMDAAAAESPALESARRLLASGNAKQA